MGCTTKIRKKILDRYLIENGDFHAMLTLEGQFPDVFLKVKNITLEIASKTIYQKPESDNSDPSKLILARCCVNGLIFRGGN